MFNTDAVLKRLSSLGVETDRSDEFAITFAVEKVRSTIKNEINWQDVPEGLEHIAVDMAVGEFLLSKKTFAPESLNIDLSYAVKQIQAGDTNTVFATGKVRLLRSSGLIILSIILGHMERANLHHSGG